ncbi:MAG: hypothetical protein IJZ29_00405 [Clostridia bacterium]|nr:hypothetical protein [Clostridia bacterium]
MANVEFESFKRRKNIVSIVTVVAEIVVLIGFLAVIFFDFAFGTDDLIVSIIFVVVNITLISIVAFLGNKRKKLIEKHYGKIDREIEIYAETKIDDYHFLKDRIVVPKEGKLCYKQFESLLLFGLKEISKGRRVYLGIVKEIENCFDGLNRLNTVEVETRLYNLFLKSMELFKKYSTEI